MTSLRFVLPPACLAAGLCIASLGAQAQNTKPPKVQLWMDLSTGTMAGMPEMDSLPGGGGMLGGLMGGMGGGAQGRAGSGNTAYGHARAMSVMPPRVIDLALHNSLRPGVEASQAIPPGMRMGESLPLIPPRAQPTQTEPGEVPQEYQQHQPKGRILLYWGCGSAVRAGQPRVIDLARAKPSDYAQAFAGRAVPDRGPRVGPAYALYPNERNQVSLSRDSSVVGEHQVRGDGVPASMKFTLGAAQDLMPAIDLRTTGKPQDSMGTSWQPVRNARAYYLHAMSQSGDDLIMWSSAETPDTGMGLFDYLSPATIDRWLKERVLLQPETTQCAIPQGIFAGGGRDATPMLRMMAYGGESHIVHPPRPADPKAAWEPEWSVRVRVKSHTMAMLGEEILGQRGGMGPAAPAGAGAGGGAYSSGMGSSGQPSGGAPSDAGTPGEVVNPVNLLRGLFGR
ncbi:hypothetical protein A1D30_19895 [Acidovorax sp. GW101-3H11]|uniref:hypothetical protein n=1 Tax=Acidovorax sp. GW101-3H11 TaxID=1813946 RepID=UPI0007B52777|nr:hypothetical protein [Acidovorax sp. GW101-3H11]KZT14259.1 hypothetical protein A1D30_19895 [Acidovorax sp. GW101-3H11]